MSFFSGNNSEKLNRLLLSVMGPYRWVLIFPYTLFMLLLAYIDVKTGYEISLSIFYLLPIAIASWYFNGRLGYVLSFLSIIILVAADIKSGDYYHHVPVLIWNSGVTMGYYLFISYALSKIKKLYEHEKELARTDPLTGVLNRRYFYIVAENEIYRAKRFKRNLSLAFFDIDNFKLVNDSLGHADGDELLKMITVSIFKNLRESDVIGRFGGDEFAILFPETGKEQVREVISKIQKILMEEVWKNKWPISFSIGVVTSLKGSHTIDEMVKTADTIMYKVKKNGKNNVKYFSMEDHVHLNKRAD